MGNRLLCYFYTSKCGRHRSLGKFQNPLCKVFRDLRSPVFTPFLSVGFGSPFPRMEPLHHMRKRTTPQRIS